MESFRSKQLIFKNTINKYVETGLRNAQNFKDSYLKKEIYSKYAIKKFPTKSSKERSFSN
jgi:hypothetical protein